MAMPNLVETHMLPELEDAQTPDGRARITRPRWNPKEWHPIYEEVVLLDCMGYKQIEIAAEKGFTVMHVNNILNTEQAKIIRRLVAAKLQKRVLGTIEERLEKVSLKALQRVEDTMENDKLYEKNPLGVFDRAMSILKGTSKIKNDSDGGTNIHKAIIVPEHQLKQLVDGLAFADEAKRLNSGNGDVPNP